MTAVEARKLTDSTSTNEQERENTVHFLAIVYRAIHREGSAGKNSLAVREAIREAIEGRGGPPTDGEFASILRILREDGYRVDTYKFGDNSVSHVMITW